MNSRPEGRAVPSVTPSQDIEQLEAQARYHRERLELYRARIYGSRPTTAAGLRERERLYEHAERRLRRAQEQETD
jgi:hypothetical protein